MDFLHRDCNEEYISLHDCIAECAHFDNGALVFDLNDGFWVLPDHPASDVSEIVRTDFARVEYILEDGAEYDASIYVFTKTFWGKIIRSEWSIQKLIESINSKKYRLEFLYQYLDGNTRIIECELRSCKKPYASECMLKLTLARVEYCWNNLRENRPW